MTETPNTLYHYCSTAAFQSIVEKNELWLTDLSLSNDRLEGKWALERLRIYLQTFETREERIITGTLLALLQDETLCLGSCFSTKRDTLSQWRGYGSDGRGLCISFSAEALKRAIEEPAYENIKLTQMCYRHDLPPAEMQRLAAARSSALKSDPEEDETTFSRPEDLQRKRDLMQKLYSFKNPAFAEEAEWRILAVDLIENFKPLKFRTHNDCLSPYLPLAFQPDDITEVILGPKHPTPVEKIELFLRQNDCQAPVTKSAASYR